MEKLILGTASITEHVRGTNPDRRIIVPEKGGRVPVSALYTIDEMKHVESTDQDKPDASRYPVAKTKTIPSRSEASVVVLTRLAGTFLVQPRKPRTAVTTFLLAKEIVEVVTDRPLYVMVPNVTDLPVKLSKHEKMVEVTEWPTIMIKMVQNGETVKIETECLIHQCRPHLQKQET